jgi:hypothetical protein
MNRRHVMMITLGVLSLGMAWTAAAGAADTETADTERARWLVARAAVETPTLHRAAATPQSDIGGGGYGGDTMSGRTGSIARPMLLSLLVPGLGEATMGYKRGYLLMAMDVASWIGVKHYHDLGHQKREDYYAYLDEHWSEQRLEAAFGTDGEAGTFFYGDQMDDETDYTDLSLWVSREDDEREYYENAGKWDQFVFGWDDFSDPRNWSVDWWHDTDPTWNVYTDLRYEARVLKDVRVTSHREIYRSMRIDSNDQFDHRDSLIYLNMFTRIFSMFQVAYLNGVFSGGGPAEFKVAGHDVTLITEPRGLLSSRLGVSVSY